MSRSLTLHVIIARACSSAECAISAAALMLNAASTASSVVSQCVMMTRQCCCGMRSCTFACGMYAGVDDPTAPTARVPTLQCCVCGSSASNQCAKCKQPAYCGRKCQRKHWTAHKTVCGSKTAKVAAIVCTRPSIQSLTLVLMLSIALHWFGIVVTLVDYLPQCI